MHVKWRDPKNKGAGYFLMDGETEVHQRGGIPDEWRAEARKRRVGIETVVLEKEGVSLDEDEEAPRVAQIVRIEHGEHHHDDRYLMGLPEHEHPLPEHDHPHTHREIGELQEELRGHEVANLEAFRLSDKALIEHGHPNLAPIVHQHADLSAAISDLGVRVKALDGHEHEKVAWHEHQDTDAKLARLSADFIELNKRLAENANELRTLIAAQAESFKAELAKLAAAKHEHPEYALAESLADHIAASGKKVELHVLSRQEVAGKTRLVVEEVQ